MKQEDTQKADRKPVRVRVSVLHQAGWLSKALSVIRLKPVNIQLEITL
jgi:hypothetical protein